MTVTKTTDARVLAGEDLDPSTLQFVVLSFEGPDPYSAAGGLSVRVRELCRALARNDYPTHLFFIGAPDLPGVEEDQGVHLHRWAQAISRDAPEGVYDREERKVEDMCVWAPDQVADLVAEGAAEGRATVVLAEDWHTVYPLLEMDRVLVERGLRHRAIVVWNANNRFGFERVDWGRLDHAATLFTISRHMKHILWEEGVNPTVVPNGIPHEWFELAPPSDVDTVRGACNRELLLAKIGRWHPDKRWHMAIEATSQLKAEGRSVVLVARGWTASEGEADHVEELRRHAASLGLSWHVWEEPVTTQDELVRLLRNKSGEVDILELSATVPEEALALLYGASDAVLANSGFEPFGLVGLEVMASGGVAITGASGEDYLVPFENGFALETERPSEVLAFLDWLRQDPERDSKVRDAARETALRYTWDEVIDRMLFALRLAAREQGVSVGGGGEPA